MFAEVVRAMDFLVSEGLIMYWGTAKWSPIDVTEMYTACRQLNCSTPILEQSEYHMLCREKVEIYMPELYNKIGQCHNVHNMFNVLNAKLIHLILILYSFNIQV